VEPTATVPPLPPPAAAALPRHTTTTTEEPLRFADHHHSRRTSHKQSKLTLSAFRRSSVRLTRADPAQKLEDHYEFRNPSGQSSAILGHGAFSTVRRAVRRADQLPVAVKSIAKHEALRARRLRVGRHGLEEWEILRKFRSHPFIVNLMEVFETEDEIILVLEYCQGGELFNAIQRRRNRKHAMRRGQYTESQAAVITSQILKALNDLHAAGIVHRDVKPENILLTETNDERIRVKLCDFGMARSLGQGDSSSAASEVGSAGSDDGLAKTSDSSPNTPGRSRAFSIVGSDYYAAPEITYGNPYDTAVDMYSLGVTLYILLCGFPPCFSGPNSDQVIFPNSYWSDVSQDAKDLVKRMLCREPLERITAREALRDKWIWQHLQYHKHRPSVLKPRVARFASPERCSNLDVIRNQLYQNLTLQASMKRPISLHPLTSSPPKRRRNDPRSSSATLLALADLYRGVAQSPVAKVLSVDPKDVRGAPQTPNPDAKAGCAGNSPASSPLRPLSV
jgi:serine/threonine protein kinase